MLTFGHFVGFQVFKQNGALLTIFSVMADAGNFDIYWIFLNTDCTDQHGFLSVLSAQSVFIIQRCSRSFPWSVGKICRSKHKAPKERWTILLCFGLIMRHTPDCRCLMVRHTPAFGHPSPRGDGLPHRFDCQ